MGRAAAGAGARPRPPGGPFCQAGPPPVRPDRPSGGVGPGAARPPARGAGGRASVRARGAGRGRALQPARAKRMSTSSRSSAAAWNESAGTSCSQAATHLSGIWPSRVLKVATVSL
jgi:hypothetical protein